jgi:hypothetical protein
MKDLDCFAFMRTTIEPQERWPKQALNRRNYGPKEADAAAIANLEALQRSRALKPPGRS